MSFEISKIRSETDNQKLARAYVVLALARDSIARYVSERPSHADLHPLLTMLDMSNGLLEQVLEHSLPPDFSNIDESEIYAEFLM